MAETPKFERSTPIKPAQATQGFGEVTSQFASFSSNIGQMGATLAQESANKYAQLQGIKDAQRNAKEGKLRPMLPSFTEADKHYAAAYQQEQSQAIAHEGQQTLQAYLRTASKTPTGDALGDYEKFGKQSIDDLVSKAPRAVQPNLRRGLEDVYLNGFNKLADRVQQSNKEYLESQNVAFANAKLDNISDLVNSNDLNAGYEALQNYKQFVNEQAEQYRVTGGQAGYAPHIAIAAMKQGEDRWHQAVFNQGWKEAEAEGKSSEYIKNARENKPKEITAAQHDQYMKGLVSYAAEYNAALSAQQTIDYIKYATKVDTGQMTEADLLQAQQKISEKQMAELEHRIATRNNSASKATLLYNESENRQNEAGFMSRYSGHEIDMIFGKKMELYNNAMTQQTGQPHEATLAEKAMVAQTINAPIPALTQELSRVANYGTPAEAVEAARSMVMLDNNNLGVTIGGMSDKDKSILNTFKDLRSDTTYSPEESLKLAREQSNVDDNTKQSRLNRWNDIKKEKDYYKDTAAKIKRIGDNIGAKTGWFRERNLVPTGLDVSFDRIMNRLIPLYADPAKAEAEAFLQLSRVNKPTNVNNRNELMKMAPPPEVWNDRYRALKEFVDKSNAHKAAGGFVLNDVDWPNAPDIDSLYSQPPIGGDLVINVDGKPRKIIIEGDLTTQWGSDMVPSYAFSYLDDDGVAMALMDFNTGEQARWIPDYLGIDKRLKLKSPDQRKTEAIEKAHAQQLRAFEDERINEAGVYNPIIGGIQ